MNTLKQFFTAGLLATFMVSSLVPVAFADSVSGSNPGTPDLKITISPNKIIEHQDVSFVVATVDGSDISTGLSNYDLGFQIISASGANKIKAAVSVGVNNTYTVVDNGSSYRITVNVDENDVLDTSSIQLPVGTYTFKFGDTNNSGGFDNVLISSQFSVVETVFGNVDWNGLFASFGTSVGNPTSIDLVPSVVQTGADVYVVAFSDVAQTKVAALPAGWDIRVWYLKSSGGSGFFPVFTIENVAKYSDGDIVKFGQENGVFVFSADMPTRTYNVTLYNASGQIVGESATLEVKIADELQAIADAFGSLGFPGANIDPSDFVEEEPAPPADPGVVVDPAVAAAIAAAANAAANAAEEEVVVVPEVVADGGGNPTFDVHIPDFIFDHAEVANPGLSPAICHDIDESFWGYDIIVSLLNDNLFPISIGDDRSASCRVETEVKRKEFTYWLLQAYQADAVADIEAFHNNYNYDNSPFTDVDGTDSYDPYIIMAAQLGIVNGNPDKTFRGDNVINRAEVLKILLRSAEIFMDTNSELNKLAEAQYSSSEPQKKFNDEGSNQEQWYTPYLHYAAVKKIIEGRKYLIGASSIVKADMAAGVKYGEAAKILYFANKLAVDGEAAL